MKKYYFVSYNFNANSHRDYGFGSFELVLDEEAPFVPDKVRKQILSLNKFDSVTLLWWKKLNPDQVDFTVGDDSTDETC